MKKRLVILDALRGIAGIVVVLLHIGEMSERAIIPQLGIEATANFFEHGYLAVEFFLLLMSYMFGLAYDRRWEQGMKFGEFMKRRFIRLHPLVVSGTLLGLAVWLYNPSLGYWSDSWCNFKSVPLGKGIAFALWSCLALPVIGYAHIYPFNACTWTIFYEYLGNIFYGAWMRKFSQWVLLALSVISLYLLACVIFQIDALQVLGIPSGAFAKTSHCSRTIAAGSALGNTWADWTPLYRSLLRLAFPMSFGLFLARTGWKIRLPSKAAFLGCVVVFVAIMCIPYEGGRGLSKEFQWVNGMIELVTLTVILPLMLLIGAGTEVNNDKVGKVSAFFGELSYPLYMTHWPFYYLYWGWAAAYAGRFSYAANVAIEILFAIAMIGVAWLVMEFWDKPVQRKLHALEKRAAIRR